MKAEALFTHIRIKLRFELLIPQSTHLLQKKMHQKKKKKIASYFSRKLSSQSSHSLPYSTQKDLPVVSYRRKTQVWLGESLKRQIFCCWGSSVLWLLALLQTWYFDFYALSPEGYFAREYAFSSKPTCKSFSIHLPMLPQQSFIACTLHPQ